ncbi:MULTISPECIES: class I SAM-dependent methyltransferase [Corallococcus]|uniref:class I SAM-dependent methyltransferase n=1 Tax=Corallococcus TaxID=83461 RepID=UPI000EDBAE65|nr:MULTISPECIES: class I SAM-dependent methyltransferase [Corallococcus]NPC72499.1 class I SAM-dependent methyltransferase [Corallococcus exiguus]NPD23041.1 class I SAM-dependent methyltransferase [Corallococcus exiguus]RKH99394.1 class I SAM-dependent methyltransferase [Corallococcus sp. AB038B]
MKTTTVNLTGVPETMLWTLHNRASEARRPDGFLRDPDCVRVADAIDYDYVRSFGKANASHSLRSRVFDDAVRPWMAAHPGGAVVELAAGLETQFHRVDDGRVRWYCVDLPESLEVRERLLPASERCRFIARSALDLTWMDEVDVSHGVFITAQGLLMYFPEIEVRRLLTAVIERFPGVELMFDTIPEWFSRATLKGMNVTPHYQTPPMPWGVSRAGLEPLLRSWSSRVTRVEFAPYRYPRGAWLRFLRLGSNVPGLRNVLPMMAHVSTAPGS